MKLTVSQLINELSKYDPDMMVGVRYCETSDDDNSVTVCTALNLLVRPSKPDHNLLMLVVDPDASCAVGHYDEAVFDEVKGEIIYGTSEAPAQFAIHAGLVMAGLRISL